MKIAVFLASRGRPAALVGVIMALWRLRSQEHDLEFHVGCDDDDSTMDSSQDMLLDMATEGLDVHFWEGKRGPLGATLNRTLDRCRGAGAAVLVSDRMFCLTPNWDAVVAKAVAANRFRIMWWSCPDSPDCTTPVFTKEWLDASDWKMSSELFPFWFDDTWLLEVDMYVNSAIPMRLPIFHGGIRAATQRLRELNFWIDVFTNTRSLRQEQALGLCNAFKKNARSWAPITAVFEENDAHLRKNAKEFEKAFGDTGAPTLEYLKARLHAEYFVNGR